MVTRRPKRCRVHRIPERCLIPLLTGRERIMNMPEGARVVAVGFDFASQCFDVLVEHESYAEIEDGQRYPDGEPFLSYTAPPRVDVQAIRAIIESDDCLAYDSIEVLLKKAEQDWKVHNV